MKELSIMATTADIRTVRKKAKLTQKQLADFYKIPVRTLIDWERGVRTPPEYVINFILRCMALDFPITEQDVFSEPVSAPKNSEKEV